MHCREDHQVWYTMFMLTRDADSWWMGQSRLLDADGRIITWTLFQEYFIGKYERKIKFKTGKKKKTKWILSN